MKKIAIVTGSDKKYFPFLKNLVFSLKKTKSLEIADLCILDVEDKSDYLAELEEFIHEKKIAKFNLELKFKKKSSEFIFKANEMTLYYFIYEKRRRLTIKLNEFDNSEIINHTFWTETQVDKIPRLLEILKIIR